MPGNNDKANVLLVGSGGVGTLASLGLECSGNASVTSVLRSDYEKVKKDGFVIESVDHGNFEGWRPTNIASSVSEAGEKHGPFDYILVCTKVLPELQKTEELIEPAVTKCKSVIVLIQNGLGIEDPVADKYPENVVLSGISMISAHNYHGKIVQYEPDELVIGYHPSSGIGKEALESSGKKFVELYSSSGANCTYSENLKFSRWKKLVFNSCINTMCALTGLDTGRSFHSGVEDELVRPAMKEIQTIAKSEGIEIPDSVFQDMVESDDHVYAKPSMKVDVEKGNPMELEAILGNPLRVAERNNVPTPVLSVVYKLLKGVQFRLMEGKGHIALPVEAPVRANGDIPYYKQH